ncbi:MAG: hypothetical protein FWD17_10365 [Polyangiaceae bacterium]|nr:hypothetical protein [Polyangiaceae bacterium]
MTVQSSLETRALHRPSLFNVSKRAGRLGSRGASLAATCAFALLAAACGRRDKVQAAPSVEGGAAAPASAAATALAAAGDRCPPSWLVPFRSYGSVAPILNIVADESHVYYRVFNGTYRVPLAGGEPTALESTSKMTGGIYLTGDRVIIQPTGSAAFLSLPKAGGAEWQPFLDASGDKRGGGTAVQGIFKNMGSGIVDAGQQAVFDGKSFYFIESVENVREHKPATFTIKRLDVSGGAAAAVLFTSNIGLSSLAKVGDELFFIRNDTPPKPAPKPGEKPTVDTSRNLTLMAMPAAGGAPEVRISPFHGVGPGLNDGHSVYYIDGPIQKMSIMRHPLSGKGEPEALDPYYFAVQQAAAYGTDRVMLLAAGPGKPYQPGDNGPPYKILAGPANGPLAQVRCFEDRPGPFALGGKTAYFAMFDNKEGAAIAKVALP